MRKIAYGILSGVSMAAMTAPAMAQSDSGFDRNADIIVTARRASESLQDIPVSVVPITGKVIKDLALTRPEEIAKLAPGLTLTPPATSQTDQAIILRGVRWSPSSGAPAVPVYLNELSFNPSTGLQSLFDIGQIEVLRGPQGTARGAPSISGAITVGTRRPDVTQFGGYVQGMVATRDHQNLQGAVNVPVIKDMLAVRIAGNFERSEGNGVRSIYSSTEPDLRSGALRVSALFTPTDTIELFGMYQNIRNTGDFFSQVAGTGSLGNPAAGIPANFNGPAIAVDQYASVAEISNRTDARDQVVSANFKWDVLGQTLSYNFGHQWIRTDGGGSQDPGNALPGFDIRNQPRQRNHATIHEIRLSSQRGDHFFDYDIGYYSNSAMGDIVTSNPSYLPGAFGLVPGMFATPVDRYTLQVYSPITITQKDKSFYGNVQLHLPHGFELAGGVRRIKISQPVEATLNLGSGFFPFPNPTAGLSGGPFPCAFLGGGLVASPVYPGFCDAPIAAMDVSVFYPNKNKATIYNVSASKKWGDNFLLYGTVGSSFRGGFAAILNTGLPLDLINPDPEKATSFEVGFKSTLAQNVRFNVALFQINYSGQLTTFQGIQYFSSASQSAATTNQSFFRNVDTRVRGFEVEFFAKPLPNLSISSNLSYAKTKSRGGLVPANPGDCAGAVPVSATNPINVCPTAAGEDVTPSPYVQGNILASYERPITEALDGYVRVNLNYQGKSRNYGISSVRSTDYALIDLYGGISGNDGAWNIGVFAKNLFNVKHELTRRPFAPDAIFGDLGYSSVTATQRRELGLQLRYSFGAQ